MEAALESAQGAPPPPEHLDASKLEAARARDRAVTEGRDPNAPANPDAQPRARNEESTSPPARKNDEIDLNVQPKSRITAAHWTALKSKLAKAEAELAKTRESSAAVSPPDLEAIKSERDQLRDILREVAIERDPEFSGKFSAAQNAVISQVKAIGGDKLASLLALPASDLRDSQISTLIEELSPTAQRRVNAALTELDRLEIQKTSEMATAKRTYDERAAKRALSTTEAQKARIAEAEGLLQKRLSAWDDPEKGNPFTQEIPGDEKHNKGVREARTLAREALVGDLPMETLVDLTLKGAHWDLYSDVFTGVVEELEAARAEIEKLQGLAPVDTGSRVAASQSDSPPDPSSPQYMIWWERQLEKARARDIQRP